eukprot:7698044-Lingulodinium_polyedra.AAC.1
MASVGSEALRPSSQACDSRDLMSAKSSSAPASKTGSGCFMDSDCMARSRLPMLSCTADTAAPGMACST